MPVADTDDGLPEEAQLCMEEGAMPSRPASQRRQSDPPLEVVLAAQLSAIQLHLSRGHNQLLKLAADHSSRETVQRLALEEEARKLHLELGSLRSRLAADAPISPPRRPNTTGGVIEASGCMGGTACDVPRARPSSQDGRHRWREIAKARSPVGRGPRRGALNTGNLRHAGLAEGRSPLPHSIDYDFDVDLTIASPAPPTTLSPALLDGPSGRPAERPGRPRPPAAAQPTAPPAPAGKPPPAAERAHRQRCGGGANGERSLEPCPSDTATGTPGSSTSPTPGSSVGASSQDDAAEGRLATCIAVDPRSPRMPPRDSQASMLADLAISGPRRWTSFLRCSSTDMVDYFLRGKAFGLVCSVVILANATYLGVQTSREVDIEFARLRGEPVQQDDPIVPDIMFTLFFTLEMLARLAVEKKKFILGREAYWNMFDTCVVISSIYECYHLIYGSSAPAGVSVLRTFRVLRVIRLLRVAGVFAPCKAVIRTLQTIIYSLSGSASSFVSALVVLFLFLFIFAISFMQGVKGYIATATPDERLTKHFQNTVLTMEEHYGTMEATLWTLLAAVSGGYDWSEVAKPISSIGGFYKLGFLLYVVFVLFALLNILTGIFVNVSIDSCKMNREIVIEEAITNKKSLVKQIVHLFHEADADSSGTLSLDEFEEFFQDEAIRAFFMSLDLDMSNARTIFEVIDTTGDGELDIEEFVQGCIDLRGGARKVDISMLQRENQQLFKRLNDLETAVNKKGQRF
eukprot:TRINITY_DN7035_c0_g1_i1.p1 TRINITY_DN7035_c0_g1~~TRINITY_DN7035_c0_g1_i1.p1  ORF type:complete len:744 (+),score=149.19 TRINITY_DN7035_c0_g1_i1:94-2325(+)